MRPTLLASTWIDVAGLRIHARVSTDERPERDLDVVLVHGLGVSSRYFVPLAEELASYARIHAPDLPGFGASARPGRVLDVAGLSEALHAWMSAARVGHAVLIGNSVGCQVVAELAFRRPDRVAAAVLVGPTMDRRARRPLPQVWRLLKASLHERPALWLVVVADYARTGPRRLLATFRHALRDPIEEKLRRVAAPTLVVRGARDAIAPQPWAEELVRLLPHGRLAVIPDAGHALNYSAPAGLARIVRSFLDSDLDPRLDWNRGQATLGAGRPGDEPDG